LGGFMAFHRFLSCCCARRTSHKKGFVDANIETIGMALNYRSTSPPSAACHLETAVLLWLFMQR
jgi:hypothetical protein